MHGHHECPRMYSQPNDNNHNNNNNNNNNQQLSMMPKKSWKEC